MGQSAETPGSNAATVGMTSRVATFLGRLGKRYFPVFGFDVGEARGVSGVSQAEAVGSGVGGAGGRFNRVFDFGELCPAQGDACGLISGGFL